MKRQQAEQVIRCENVHSILDEYLAGELDIETQEGIETHLIRCQHCQNEMDFALEIGEGLRELPKPQPPPEILNHVAAHVRSHPNPTSQGWRKAMKQACRALHLRPLSICAASICLVCLVLFGAYRQHQRSVEIEKASRDLSYALRTVRYAVQKTGVAIDARFPADQVREAPRRALVLALNEIHTTASEHLSRAIRGSFFIRDKNQKEKDKS